MCIDFVSVTMNGGNMGLVNFVKQLGLIGCIRKQQFQSEWLNECTKAASAKKFWFPQALFHCFFLHFATLKTCQKERVHPLCNIQNVSERKGTSSSESTFANGSTTAITTKKKKRFLSRCQTISATYFFSLILTWLMNSIISGLHDTCVSKPEIL